MGGERAAVRRRPPQHQRRPAVDILLLGEGEALRPIGGEHPRDVAQQKPREHQLRPRRRCAGDGGRQQAQWFRQNIREDEVVAPGHRRMAQADRHNRPHEGDRPIRDRICARGLDRHGVDVSAGHLLPQQLRRRYGEYAGSRADVQHAARAAALGDPVEGAQAAERRTVMAGAEGQRRLDLDPNVVGSQSVPAMGAVHHDPAGAHGLQPGERL